MTAYHAHRHYYAVKTRETVLLTYLPVESTGFGALVRKLRADNRLTQAALAEKLKSAGLGELFSQSTVSAWEAGRQTPDRDRLPLVARALASVSGISENDVIDSILRLDEIPRSTGSPQAGAFNREAGSDDVFRVGRSLIEDVRAAVRVASAIWVINPGALAMASEEDVIEIWKEGIISGVEYSIIWILDDIGNLTMFRRGRDAFMSLQEALRKHELSVSRLPGRVSAIKHYGIARADGGLVKYYNEMRNEINEYDYMKFFDIIKLENIKTELGFAHRVIHMIRSDCKISCTEDFDSVNNIDISINSVLQYCFANSVTVLYENKGRPTLNIRHRDIVSPDGRRIEDAGFWRPEDEARALSRAVADFSESIKIVFSSEKTDR